MPRPGQTPPDPSFICFEPVDCITDAMNLQHAGKYSALQSVSPGGTWEESFRIIPRGF